MESLNVFDDKFSEIIQKGVKILSLTQSDAIDTIETNILEKTENIALVEDGKKILTCSHCKVTFEDIFLHREHFKLDWHRYNLKQSLLGKKCVTEEEFQVKTGEDDLSSISGSDSEEENLDTFVTSQGKIFLQNGAQQVFSLYKCIIFEKKEEISDETIFIRLNDSCVKNKQWTLFMLGGGHFAGAVFQNNNPILHKTFHCYTVRQGQGGSQSSKDNKSGGSHPKSAGASLRRYNEQALAQHVRNIVELWKQDMAKSSLIIFRASGPYNRSVLFGGSNPILEKNDPRLRTIPFATRRATFTEIKRVQGILTTAKIYENLEAAINTLDKTKTGQDSRRPKTKNPNINRSKSREIIERPLPTKISENEEFTSDSSYDEENLLIASDNEINFKDLQVFDNSFTSKELKKVHRRKKPKKSKAKKLQEKEQFRKDEYKKVLNSGNVVLLKELLEERLRSFEGQETDKNVIKDEFLNEVLDDDGNTPLHLSALSEHLEMTKYLLEQNSDPCLKNKKQLTPYCVTQNKEIREIMKQFARENSEKHNYNKAQIPTQTLTPEQMAERKKTQRKIKKEKDKIKKIESDIKKKEELEQDRFLKLSDREKRALAAERRIKDQSGKIIARCFLCAIDISGKVPFEYMGNRFCTVECLKAHRMQNPIVLS